MTAVFAGFIIAFVCGAALTRLAISFAWRWKILDWPDGWRKLQVDPVPRFGGPGILAAAAIPIFLLFAFPGLSAVAKLLYDNTGRIASLLVICSMAMALGAWDDIARVGPRTKLMAQIAIGVLAYIADFRIDAVNSPFGNVLQLGVFALPVTVFWFVGCMNAVNLLDGLDGLAAGAVLFVCLTLMLVSLNFGNFLALLLLGSFGGAVLGFLVFNFPPARIFLGDSGSILLGTTVAALSLLGSSRKAEAAVALLVPLVAMGLPVMDTVLAILRRWYKKMPITEPDRKHIHHILVSMGYSQRRAVLILYGVCVLFGLSALIITLGRSEATILILGAMIVVGLMAVRVFAGMGLRGFVARLNSESRTLNSVRMALAAAGRATHAIDVEIDDDEVWRKCCSVFDTLGVKTASMILERPGGRNDFTWKRPNEKEKGSETSISFCALKLDLLMNGHVYGFLEVQGDLDQAIPVQNVFSILKDIANTIATREARIAKSIQKA